MKENCCQNHPPGCCCKPGPGPVPAVPFYAQYGVLSGLPSGSLLPFLTLFEGGEKIHLEGSSVIILPAGYLYLIEYTFLATPEANGYLEITPELNGTPRLLYSAWGSAGAARNASAAAGFTTNEALTQDLRLSLRLSYSESTRNLDLSGAVSVTPLMEFLR